MMFTMWWCYGPSEVEIRVRDIYEVLRDMWTTVASYMIYVIAIEGIGINGHLATKWYKLSIDMAITMLASYHVTVVCSNVVYVGLCWWPREYWGLVWSWLGRWSWSSHHLGVRCELSSSAIWWMRVFPTCVSYQFVRLILYVPQSV